MTPQKPETEQTSGKEMASSLSEISINYRKIEDYRILHVDGAMAGITPRGYINLELYTERGAIPRSMLHPIVDGKKIGSGTHPDGMGGVLRLIHTGIVLDLGAAENLLTLLRQKMDELKSHMSKDEGK